MKTHRMGVMFVAVAAVAAILWVTAGDALARAGGGQSSSHSSSSSKSSSSSSSSKSWGGSSSSSSKPWSSSSSKSSGSSSYGGYSPVSTGCGLLGMGLGAMFGGAGFIVFVIIAIVVAVLKKASAGRAAPPPSYEPPPGDAYEPPSSAEPVAAAVSGLSTLDALKAKDPNFSERVFLDKAQTIFFELQKAWMARDLKPIRPYVSDGVFNRWQVFIDQYKRDKQINLVKDPVINNARVVRVQQESDIDSITVQLDCSMADAMVSESNPNQVISGSLTDHKPFTEYWTFIRKASSQTKADATAKIDKCPNCGAPLKVSAAGNCEFCDTLVHSPEYDWILNQITQAEEWA